MFDLNVNQDELFIVECVEYLEYRTWLIRVFIRGKKQRGDGKISFTSRLR